jgi:phosphatidylglycerophosphate synthase
LPDASALAYKAYEIEELVDIYFYRRLGYVVAHAARTARLSPNAVSILAGLIGAAGGALIAWPHLALFGVALLVLHGIVDSADGQLARMTGQSSELGRILDGVSGYVTHIALYLAIVSVVRRGDGSWWVLGMATASGMCTAIQAQMYDYHRTAYAVFAIKGRVPIELAASSVRGPFGALAAGYAASQRAFLGLHHSVEQIIAVRSSGNVVRDDDRQRYRECFYRPVRGWNLLGDNVRRYAIAVFVVLQHPEWFMAFTLGPMNLVLLGLWLYQRAADRRFLGAFDPAWTRNPPA